MHATGKIFDKISLKLLGISFFGICDPWSEEGSTEKYLSISM